MQNIAKLQTLLAQKEQELTLLRSQLRNLSQVEQRQKEAMAQLARKSQQLETILGLSKEITFILNDSLLYRYASVSLTATLGFLPTQIIGSNLTQFVHPEDLSRLQTAIQMSYLSPGLPGQSVEYRALCKDGSWCYLAAVVTNLLADPSIGGLLITGHEITERKRLEANLAISEQKLMAFYQSEVIGIASGEGELITEANEAFLTMLGYTSQDLEEAGGLNWLKITPPDQQTRSARAVEEAIVSGRFAPFEKDFFRKDGVAVPTLIGGICLNKDPFRFIAFSLDITAQKRAQAIQSFILEFGEKLRPLIEESAVWHLAASELEQHLAVDRCYFAEVSRLEGQPTILIQPDNGDQELLLESLERVQTQTTIDPLEALLIKEAVKQDRPIAIENSRTSTFVRELEDSGTYQAEAGKASSILVVPFPRDEETALIVVIRVWDTLRSWPQDEIAMLQSLVERVWLSVHNARLYQQVQEAAVEHERARFARDLHDSIQQTFFGIQLSTSTARALLKVDLARAAAQLETILAHCEGGMSELRALIFDLRPEGLASQGIVAGLQNKIATLETVHGLEVVTRLGAEPRVPLKVKEALYWIGREALHNIVKHAQATRVEVELEWDEKQFFIELSIIDNGRGFDPNGDFTGHIGLQSMRERAGQWGSSITIESKVGAGTVIRARLLLGDNSGKAGISSKKPDPGVEIPIRIKKSENSFIYEA